MMGANERHVCVCMHVCVCVCVSQVLCEHLDMEWMWRCLPQYAEFVDDLPVGE